MFLGGQGRPCRADLGKGLNLGLNERRAGEEVGLDGGCVAEDDCCDWERERRVWRYLYITKRASRGMVRCALGTIEK